MNNCQLKNVIVGKRDYRWGEGELKQRRSSRQAYANDEQISGHRYFWKILRRNGGKIKWGDEVETGSFLLWRIGKKKKKEETI